MVMVELKGLHTVKSKGKTYYYAWRGGPRIKGVPGTPEFQASYNEAVANHRAPDGSRFRSIVTLYKNSGEYKKLAPTTRYNWSRWLDRITDYFGDLSIEQFNRADRIRPVIRKWRAKYAETPRAADYGMQVLSRVLSFAVDPLGKVSSNPCEGIKQLYDGSRSEIIWTDSDIAQLKETCSQEIAWAVDLAGHTGLRVSDLIALSWSHVHDDAIIIATGKSKHRREAVIPRYDALNEVLARIPKRSTAILTTSKKTPWTRDGLGSSFNKAKINAGMKDRNLHFHDLRGTAATKFYTAGLSLRVVAEIMGWEEDNVAKIIRRYVERDAALKAAIRQLNEAGK